MSMNIEINIKTENSYDTVYPKSNFSNIIGIIEENSLPERLKGNLCKIQTGTYQSVYTNLKSGVKTTVQIPCNFTPILLFIDGGYATQNVAPLVGFSYSWNDSTWTLGQTSQRMLPIIGPETGEIILYFTPGSTSTKRRVTLSANSSEEGILNQCECHVCCDINNNNLELYVEAITVWTSPTATPTKEYYNCFNYFREVNLIKYGRKYHSYTIIGY